MKKLIKKPIKSVIKSSNNIQQPKKLKRTVESGHSYKYPVVFDTIEDLERWEEEDKLYED